jgi:hypothetical protein
VERRKRLSSVGVRACSKVNVVPYCKRSFSDVGLVFMSNIDLLGKIGCILD